MPSQAPATAEAAQAQLGPIGMRIRSQRKFLGVSATVAAQAAGLSRVTLHRIERGEPSVTIGAYLNAIVALGLELSLFDPHPNPRLNQQTPPQPQRRAAAPATIVLADHAQLRQLAWQLPGVTVLTPPEALQLYERNWRHVDAAAMDAGERELVATLVREVGGGRLLV